MLAIHYKVKENGGYIGKAVYTLLALNMQGRKEILGLHVSENEGANYWLPVLIDLNNHGVKDILIACVGGLTGLLKAVAAIFSKTKKQLCMIHHIPNSIKYVASKDQKAFMTDLKTVYGAANKGSSRNVTG